MPVLLARHAPRVGNILRVRVFVREEVSFVRVQQVVADVGVGVIDVMVVKLLEHVGHLDAFLGGLAVDEPASGADLFVETQRVHRPAASSQRIVQHVPHHLPVVASRIGEPLLTKHGVSRIAHTRRKN